MEAQHTNGTCTSAKFNFGAKVPEATTPQPANESTPRRHPSQSHSGAHAPAAGRPIADNAEGNIIWKRSQIFLPLLGI